MGDFDKMNSEWEKLFLGTKFDYKLTFYSHVLDLRKNARQTLAKNAS